MSLTEAFIEGMVLGALVTVWSILVYAWVRGRSDRGRPPHDGNPFVQPLPPPPDYVPEEWLEFFKEDISDSHIV